ncbi:YncE family protein [Microbispora bryophytorum]|uniref:YncE family protein n=1 Tax=Microbispora bryophytorum TaxID=1460882 RepID=UPI00340456E6
MIITFPRKRPSRSSTSESGIPGRSSPREESGGFHKSSITRLLACLATTLAVTAGLFVVHAPAASAADITTDLGITSGGDVVAGGGKAFIAGGDRILVVNANGTPNATIAGLSGALGLAIAPNGTRLYAALRDSNEVAVIDTASLEIIRLISLAEYPCPTNLALSGTRLFVGYGCDQWDGGVVRIDTSFGHASQLTPVASTYASPKVAAAGNTLVVGDSGHSPASLTVYDVIRSQATLRGIIDGYDYDTGFLGDLAITPDGSTVIATFLDSHEYFAWDTSSLQKVRAYGPDPTAGYYLPVVAVSPDGTLVAGGRGTKSGLGMTLYDSATAAPVHTGTLTEHGGRMDLRSLTFSNNDLFATWRDVDSEELHLWRLETGTLPESTLTLTAPNTGAGADILTLTGRLTLPDGSAPGEQPLSVTRYVNDSAKLTFGATTAEDGTFTFKDQPRSAGVIRYDVIWNGSPTVHWSAASATVTLVKAVSSITLSGPETGILGTQLTFSGVLSMGGQPVRSSTPLRILREVTNSNGTVVTALPPVSSITPDGRFRFRDTPAEAGEYSYRVEFDGDRAGLPTTATLDVTVEEAPQE